MVRAFLANGRSIPAVILRVLLLTVGVISFIPSAAQALCDGCTQSKIPNTLVCSASCLTQGYTLSVVKQVPGGLSLPPECAGVNSATGEYLILEGSTMQRNYSQAHYLGIAQNPNLHVTNVQVLNPPANALYCEMNTSGPITPPVYVLTFANTQGTRKCIAAHAGSLDCGNANFMAGKFNPYSNMAPLPLCGDSCNGLPYVDPNKIKPQPWITPYVEPGPHAKLPKGPAITTAGVQPAKEDPAGCLRRGETPVIVAGRPSCAQR